MAGKTVQMRAQFTRQFGRYVNELVKMADNGTYGERRTMMLLRPNVEVYVTIETTATTGKPQGSAA